MKILGNSRQEKSVQNQAGSQLDYLLDAPIDKALY